MTLAGRSLVSAHDFPPETIEELLRHAARFADEGGGELARGKILATLFYEPSTRTRLSFESAMLRLGGTTLGFADAHTSSAAKGETIADTIRMAQGYADIIVQRHPKDGSAKVAADVASVPFVNGGDGGHEHPTQTLTDLFCLWRKHGTLQGLTVGLCGDLKYGRTVHSLAPALARFGSRAVCIAPESLQMPERFLAEVEAISGERPRQTEDLEAALGELDCLYMTRIQKERFPDEAAYKAVAGSYVLDGALMRSAPESMIVMHPLPRVDEIAPEVDSDPRAVYFEQAVGGVHARMALIAALLGLIEVPAGEEPAPDDRRRVPHSQVGPCENGRCVTHTERGLSSEYVVVSADPPVYVCEYCEAERRNLALDMTT